VFDYPKLEFREIYRKFSSPINDLDCGRECSKFNPNNIPFCCELSFAIPAAYHDEWQYLKKNTDLWRVWKAEDFPNNKIKSDNHVRRYTRKYASVSVQRRSIIVNVLFERSVVVNSPSFLLLQKIFASLGWRMIGNLKNKCWVISHLDQVSDSLSSGIRADF
jgi:hypothetical protein